MTAPICRSHILPEFLYKPLYDERHRYFVVRRNERKHGVAQRGLTEPLLCGACEQRFGRYEKYAAEVMSGRLGHQYRRRGRRITLDGIDYKRFKLFQMSVLWRGAVSSLDFFRLVELGPHEEQLRGMLLSDDPGAPHRFGCAVVFTTEYREDISDTFFNPEPLRWCDRRMMKFFFAGSAWLFHCDPRPAPRYLQELFLQENGSFAGLVGDLAEGRLYGAEAKRIARRLRI